VERRFTRILLLSAKRNHLATWRFFVIDLTSGMLEFTF